MGREAPPFWWRPFGWQAAALTPAALAYGAVARWRLDHGERAVAAAPVLCVGNFTAGGGGKTPTALALGRAAREMGLKPGFLSRGYGGSERGPIIVDPRSHDASTVGDEPLLLAEAAATVVAADRSRGAELLTRQHGVDLIIMDDGFQSARLHIDFAVVVIDAGRGLGNGAVIPAGPLRAPLRDQIRWANALLVIGQGSAGDAAIQRVAPGGKLVFRANLQPQHGERLRSSRVLAFAGIADPGKFYRTLRSIGADIAATRNFPDHHAFTEQDLADLSQAAARDGLQLVTTRKDAVRLSRRGRAADAFLASLEVVDVELRFETEEDAPRFIRGALAAFRRETL